MDDRLCRCRVELQKITLSQSQKRLLVSHAEKESPNESCAILFGAISNQSVIVKEVFLALNAEESPVNFTIPNEQLIECYKLAEKKNMDVVGIFHSHPKSIAYPSETDRKFMHSNPVVWVIYSGNFNEFKSYVLDTDVIEIQTEFL